MKIRKKIKRFAINHIIQNIISRRVISVVLCVIICLSGLIIFPIRTLASDDSGYLGLIEIYETTDYGEGTVTIYGMESSNGSNYCAVYCIEKGKDAGSSYNVSLDDEHVGWGNDYSNKVLWIADHGYKGMFVAGKLDDGNFTDFAASTPEEAYLATQWAIWHFTDSFNPPVDAPTGVLDMYNMLISGANSATGPALSKYDYVYPGSEPEVDIMFEDMGFYDGDYYGPVKIGIATINFPYDIWEYEKIEIVVNPGSYTLYDESKYTPLDVSSDGTVIVRNGEEFYIRIGSPPGGVVKLVSARVRINCTVEDSGFFFWCPGSTGTQSICGWGDYQVKSDYIGAGESDFSIVSLQIGGNKNITGDPPPSERMFYFTLAEDSPYREIQTISCDYNGGSFNFSPIVLPSWDYSTRTYKIYETDESDGEWAYDPVLSKRVTVTFVAGIPNISYPDGNTFSNSWDGGPQPEYGDLQIDKILGDNYADWAIHDGTIFQAYIYDETDGGYVILDYNNEYAGIGDSGSPVSFSVSESVLIKNLPAGHMYRVEEIEEWNYKAYYEHGDSVTVYDGICSYIEITNNYEHDTSGVLSIMKELDGFYEEWSVGANNTFQIRVKDITENNYLLFNDNGSGNYSCYGNSGSSTPETGDIITISTGQSATITNLWTSSHYAVEEIINGPYSVDYSSEDINLSYESVVTVTNTYKHAVGILTVNKRLAGNYPDWNVHTGTDFKVMIKDVTRNNFLWFKDTPESDGSYHCVGNDVDGLSESYSGNVIMELPLSVSQSLTLSNLWADTTYEVVESGGAHYAVSYENNGTAFTYDGYSAVTVINTFEHGSGNLVIDKHLAGYYTDWGINPSSTFQIKIKDIVENKYLRFTGAGPEYDWAGYSATGDLLTISAGQSIKIKNLPTIGEYQIEEIGGTNYTPEYQYENEANFAIIKNGLNSSVTIVNDFIKGNTGVLIINKKLAGSYDDWGADNETTYQARIKDGSGNYLRLTGTGPEYEFNGTSRYGSLITVSVGQSARIIKLPDGKYTVEEIGGTNYTADYRYEQEAAFATVIYNQNSTVTITNAYEHDTGKLIITKRLAGSYADWGIDSNTTYQARVIDVTNNNYLLFTDNGSGNYYCYGNSGSSDPETGDIINVSVGQPVNITNLWVNCRYKVEEIGGENYTVGYYGNSVILSKGANRTVRIINTYKHGTGNLVISKQLAGNFADWENVDNSTVFKAKIKDVTNNNYLLFKDTPETDGSYWCVGNDVDGLSEDYDGDTIDEVSFSVGQPVNLSNLWAGIIYEVQEIEDENYTATYKDNTIAFPEGQNRIVTVVNTYEPDVPDEPGKPGNPVYPSYPVNPDAPEDPDEPEEPEDPDGLDEPDDPDDPNDSDTDNDDHDDSENPDDTDDFDEPEDPDDPDEPSDPDDPNDPNAPDDFDDPENPDDYDNIQREGGFDHNVPPIPNISGNTIVYIDDDTYIEIDPETGVPLGEWRWDYGLGKWVYYEYEASGDLPKVIDEISQIDELRQPGELSQTDDAREIPQTGDAGYKIYVWLLLLSGFGLITTTGLIIKRKYCGIQAK